MACWDQAKGDVPVFPELLPAGAALALTLTIEKPGPSQRVPPKIRALASLPPCPIRMPQHSGGNGDHTLLLFFPPLWLLLFCLLDWCTLLAQSPNAEVPKRSSSRCLLHPGPAHPCPGLQHIPLPSRPYVQLPLQRSGRRPRTLSVLQPNSHSSGPESGPPPVGRAINHQLGKPETWKSPARHLPRPLPHS